MSQPGLRLDLLGDLDGKFFMTANGTIRSAHGHIICSEKWYDNIIASSNFKFKVILYKLKPNIDFTLFPYDQKHIELNARLYLAEAYSLPKPGKCQCITEFTVFR